MLWKIWGNSASEAVDGTIDGYERRRKSRKEVGDEAEVDMAEVNIPTFHSLS